MAFENPLTRDPSHPKRTQTGQQYLTHAPQTQHHCRKMAIKENLSCAFKIIIVQYNLYMGKQVKP